MSSHSIHERFLSHITIDEGGCWQWNASIMSNGYGCIRIDKKTYATHRVAWTLYRGDIPAGMCVLHHCDNRRCANPDHLFLGTHADNVRDKTGKGRTPSGENHWAVRIPDADVAAIRAHVASGMTQSAVASMYHVDPSTISLIVSGKRRK